MTFIALVLAVALALGWLRGGSFDRLAAVQLREPWLVVIAAAATVLGSNADRMGLPAPQAVHVITMVLSAGLVCVFVVRNGALPGIPLVAIGFALNALVIVANGAMPVSERAAERAGVDIGSIRSGHDAKHERSGRGTLLRPLADVVPVPLPGPLRRGSDVVSAGDIALAAGLAALVLASMRDAPGGRFPSLPGGDHHVEERSQAPGPREEEGQPRQASQHIARGS